jgi:hypothetical protein
MQGVTRCMRGGSDGGVPVSNTRGGSSGGVGVRAGHRVDGPHGHQTRPRMQAVQRAAGS